MNRAAIAAWLRRLANRLAPLRSPGTTGTGTVREIIGSFGGNTAVGRILGKAPSTISEMKRRGSIPVEYWPALVAAAPNFLLALRDNRIPFVLTNDMLVDAHVRDAPTELRATG